MPPCPFCIWQSFFWFFGGGGVGRGGNVYVHACLVFKPPGYSLRTHACTPPHRSLPTHSRLHTAAPHTPHMAVFPSPAPLRTISKHASSRDNAPTRRNARGCGRPSRRCCARWGLYKLNPVETHSLKAPGFNPQAYEVKTRFQSLLSNSSTCAATARARWPAYRATCSAACTSPPSAAAAGRGRGRWCLHSVGLNAV
jgi:hypothetical protein